MCPGRGRRAGNTGHLQMQLLPAEQAGGAEPPTRVLASSRRPRRCQPDKASPCPPHESVELRVVVPTARM